MRQEGPRKEMHRTVGGGGGCWGALLPEVRARAQDSAHDLPVSPKVLLL